MALFELPVFGGLTLFEGGVNRVDVRSWRDIDTDQPSVCSFIRAAETRERFPERIKIFFVRRLAQKEAVGRVSTSFGDAIDNESPLNLNHTYNVPLAEPVPKKRNISETVKTIADWLRPQSFELILGGPVQADRHPHEMFRGFGGVFQTHTAIIAISAST
jgi:hypothetical protein